MEGEGGIERLEERLAELEGLVEDLDGVPDGELVGALNRAVGLLKEINAGIEAGLGSAKEGAREMDEILDGVNFGPFDEALTDAERRSPGER